MVANVQNCNFTKKFKNSIKNKPLQPFFEVHIEKSAVIQKHQALK